MDKFLLFTTGGGSADPMNWSSNEASVYSANDLRGIKPTSASTLEVFFSTQNGNEVVILTIVNGSHSKVMKSIINTILSSKESLIPIADVDNNRFVNKNINGVSIKSQETYIQSLTGNSRTKIVIEKSNYSSCLIANTHSADVTCGLELHDGSTYTYLMKAIIIPSATTLKLESDEISFDNSVYDLYATSNHASGLLTFTFNY